MTDRFDVVIVGLGPAGLAAAAELARLNINVAAVDENPEPGGQVYRRPLPGFKVTDERFLGRKFKQGRRLAGEFASVRDRCVVYNGTEVWGSFHGDLLALIRGEEIFQLGYKKLILAEGAMERPRAFPGWTTPGIMTLGGLHKLVVQDRTLPGRRFLLSGVSPLLLPAAAAIIEAGGEIAAICDPLPRNRYFRMIPEFFRHWELGLEAWSYLYPVLRKAPGILRHYALSSARGGSRVDEVTVAESNGRGGFKPGSEKTFHVDAVGVSNGFIPQARLARLLGCGHDYDPRLQYWRPRTDHGLRSTVPGVYIAGDSNGIGGRDLAETEGRLAALNIAFELGALSAPEMHRKVEALQRDLINGRRYASVFADVFSPESDPVDLSDPNAIVCRCEGITVGEVEAGLDLGYRNINEMKRTRIGMGLCQGRTCESIVARIMLRRGLPVEEIGYFNLRPPLRPLPFSHFENYASSGQ